MFLHALGVLLIYYSRTYTQVYFRLGESFVFVLFVIFRVENITQVGRYACMYRLFFNFLFAIFPCYLFCGLSGSSQVVKHLHLIFIGDLSLKRKNYAVDCPYISITVPFYLMRMMKKPPEQKYFQEKPDTLFRYALNNVERKKKKGVR